jgi:hypothetical protein
LAINFPQKLAKLIEFTLKKQNIPKVSPIFGVKKVQNLLEKKNAVKEGLCWKGGIFWV